MYPLTAKQSIAWALSQRGIPPSEIAERTKNTRQYVHQTLKIAETKVSKALLEVARSGSLQILKMQPEQGIMVGYQPMLNRNVVVTFTTKNGVKVWYWHDKPEKVTDEKLLRETREYLFNEAEERGIRLTPEEKNMHPARLAQTLFTRLLGEIVS